MHGDADVEFQLFNESGLFHCCLRLSNVVISCEVAENDSRTMMMKMKVSVFSKCFLGFFVTMFFYFCFPVRLLCTLPGKI